MTDESDPLDTTYQRRARTVAAINPPELQSLRVKTWFANVLRAAGLDDGSGESISLQLTNSYMNSKPLLQKMLNREIGKLSDTYFDTIKNFSKQSYDRGMQTPGDRALQAIEKLFPGTLTLYEHGPLGEPLWLVLSGDEKACKQYVDSLFPEKVGQPFEDIVLELFKNLLSPAYFITPDQVPTFGQSFPHPVWTSYTYTIFEERLPLKKADEEVTTEPELLLETSVIDEMIIGTIAAWSLSIDQKQPIAISLEWLLVGLCQGVIGQVFTPDIQVYVLALVKRRAQEIESVLKWIKHPVPDFTNRWTVSV